MNLIDKFLKKLNTNRNTFATYIFTLLTFYIAIDRIVEMLLMIFTGVSTSYWGPIKYTLAIACPVLAFSFSGSSAFADSKAKKITLFYTYLIGLYIIMLSMVTQWVNMGCWLLLISTPNYVNIVEEFPSLIKHAFCAISLYFPLVTVYPFIKKIILDLDDSLDVKKSLWDYGGIKLSGKDKNAAYACDISIVADFEDGKKVKLAENRRFQSLFVCGASGTGKTALVFEPMIAQDIEKKFFFREASKELGFTALKTGIATLSAPYSNDYLNQNFTLNMLSPAFGKETLFKTFMQKMILSNSGETVYKNLGLTYMSPDYDAIQKMTDVCDNYGVKYFLIDPSQPEKSIGLNPFVYDKPNEIAVTISSTLQGITTNEANEMKDAYQEEISLQILENLSILLKVIYPQMHDGLLPNMEDLLQLLSNFELVEKMCEILKKDEELAQKYSLQLSYFKRNFYSDSKGKAETEKYVYPISSRLENLLRSSSIKNILCNRHNNINFDVSLKRGDFIFVCTRRGESGKAAHKAFGLFYLLSMQDAIFRRPGSESSRIPHFLYIDEFPDFLCNETESMFTMYRKFKVAPTISAQSIKQLNPDESTDTINHVIIGNCANKIFTGGAPIEELNWWQEEIGFWKQWQFKRDYDLKTGDMGTTLKEPKYGYVIKVSYQRLQGLPADHCAYRLLNSSGKAQLGEGMLNYLGSKYKTKHPSKNYNFEKYSNASSVNTKEDTETSTKSSKKFNTKTLNFVDSNGDGDPVKNNPLTNPFDFNNDNAIYVNLKRNKKNNDNNEE